MQQLPGLASFASMIGPVERRSSGVEWQAVESRFSVRFPEDYKAWAEIYPSLRLNDFMRVNNYLDFPPDVAYGFAVSELSEFREVTDKAGRSKILTADGQKFENLPAPVYFPDSGGLLCWGGTDNGESLMWETDPDPAKWRVVVSNAVYWWETGLGFLDFLNGLLSGELESPEFPEELLEDRLVQPIHRRIDAEGQFQVERGEIRAWG